MHEQEGSEEGDGPSDRLLVESHVHASMDVTLDTAGAVAYASDARGEKIEDLA